MFLCEIHLKYRKPMLHIFVHMQYTKKVINLDTTNLACIEILYRTESISSGQHAHTQNTHTYTRGYKIETCISMHVNTQPNNHSYEEWNGNQEKVQQKRPVIILHGKNKTTGKTLNFRITEDKQQDCGKMIVYFDSSLFSWFSSYLFCFLSFSSSFVSFLFGCNKWFSTLVFFSSGNERSYTRKFVHAFYKDSQFSKIPEKIKNF